MTREHFIEGDPRNQARLDKEQNDKFLQKAKESGRIQVRKKGEIPKLVEFKGIKKVGPALNPEGAQESDPTPQNVDRQTGQDWAEDLRAQVKLKELESKSAVEEAREELKRLFKDD